MHFTKVMATSLSLACLATCSEVAARSSDLDAIRNGWSDTNEVFKRQNSQERVVQIVTVSDNNGTLKYFPESVTADVGSVIQFQFYPKNHTITESSFAAPCMPIASNLTTPNRPGQKSGFVPVTVDTQFRPVYNLIVNDTRPMWIYCGQAPHCQKGMAMVINQNMTDTMKTLEKYKAAAALVPVPGSSSAAATSSTSASTSTVTSSVAMTSAAGPSLVGSTTTGAAEQQSGTASASVATFTGSGNAVRDFSAGWVVAAGAVWALL